MMHDVSLTTAATTEETTPSLPAVDTSSGASDEGSAYLWLLILPILVALTAIILAVYVIYKLYHKPIRRQVTAQSNSLVSAGTWPGVYCDSLSVERLIQDTPHYIVAQAQLTVSSPPGTRRVAVKILKQAATDVEKKFFLHEAQAMRSIPANNYVLRALNTCTDTDPGFLLVEFPPGGVLIDVLRDMRVSLQRDDPDVCHVMTRDLLWYGVQIARGMTHLSSLQILHRDLSARNVLLGTNNNCKLINFASAADVRDTHAAERETGAARPRRWFAPECLTLDAFTTLSDVWAYGILLWEICTLGGTPYPGAAKNDVMIDVCKGYVMTQPLHCSFELFVILSRCWAHKASDRPSFDQLADFLAPLTVNSSEYLHLPKYTPTTFPVMKCDRTLEIV